MSDITISVVQPPSTTINVGVDETLIVGAGISFPSHSVTHISGGSDELNHNLLGGLQGGSVNQYYHISSGQYFNLTTGDVVRPSETGIFYTNDNLSGFITGVDLSAYATINYVSGASGNIQLQVTSLNNATGSYVLDSETGSFITTSQTGQFYSSRNPSGYITEVDLSFSGNYYTKDESESRYVNITGAEIILGDKTFHDKVYINNLYVTGLETIVNTTNTNVASNYIMLNLTGGAVDGGIFFVTGSGLTGINDSGAIIGFDHSDKFKFGIGTRGQDLSVLDTIASEHQVTGASGYLQTQITTLNNQTGDYVLNTETGNFITTNQTGEFYSNNNPSGFITGVDLSAYVLDSETGSFITNSQTGSFYSNSNPSGYITGISDIVYTTGDQIITGQKRFLNSLILQSDGNQLRLRTGEDGNTIFITTPTINASRTYTLPDVGANAAFVMTAGPQTINGVKNFNVRPTVATTGVALVSEIANVVYTTGDQKISGIKIFGQNTNINSSTNSHILGGINNTITSGTYCSIVGGQNNHISGTGNTSTDYVNIGGGLRNNVYRNYGAIVGGQDNTVSGNHSFIGGGRFNTGNGIYSTIIGGDKNLSTSNYVVICGGESNNVSQSYSSILGGKSNRVIGTFSCVLGGSNNTNQSTYSVIGGGYFNDTAGNFSVIGGGYFNKHLVINTFYSFIGGGYTNVNYGQYSVICGGFSNQTSFEKSFIGCGSSNSAAGSHSSVVCGYLNEANNQYSCVLNGTNNKVLGVGGTTNILNGAANRAIKTSYSYIGNGLYNLISGYDYEFNEAIETYFVEYSHILNGEYNGIFGKKSSILNGDNNIISGEGNTIVCGNRSYIEPNHTGAVILADRQDRDHLSKGSDTCSLDFANGVYLRLPSFTGSKDQAGNLGELKVSGEYLYIATGQNTWGRIQISTF